MKDEHNFYTLTTFKIRKARLIVLMERKKRTSFKPHIKEMIIRVTARESRFFTKTHAQFYSNDITSSCRTKPRNKRSYES